jgi:pentatricopeptide repeat-containing protein PET309
VDELLLGLSASEALQAVLAGGEEGKEELAWRLYLAIPKDQGNSTLQADLLDYLSAPVGPFDANRIIGLFDDLPVSDRRASSYRAAIGAYLALGTVDPAVELHEEAASRDVGADIATDVLLGRAVQHNQWDLGLRVLKSFIALASRNGFDVFSLYQDPSRREGSFKIVWGRVSELPYLRGHLDSFFLHLEQFRYGLLSTSESRKALRLFLLGLTAETTEQILQTIEEEAVGEFLVAHFEKLRELGLSNADLYEYTIRRMLQLPMYRKYSNMPKPWLTLYHWYRRDCQDGTLARARPSKPLIRELIVQFSVHRSTKGIEGVIKDFRTFYPDQSIPYKALRCIIDYYADSGQVDEVHQFFEEFAHAHKDRLDLQILTALPYAYARRVDIEGTEKQFKRITEEFGQTPDTACWNVLLLAYTRADDLDGALACFNRLLAAGATPDRLTFGPLLDLCAARGDIEAYETLYARAEQLNIPIRKDVRARAGFVQALLNFGDPQGAEATAHAMFKNKRSGLLDGSLTHTWNLLIQYYAMKGDIDSSRRLYRQMLENKIPLDTWTYASLMRALIEVKQTNAAYKILRVTMPNNNIKVHAFHYALVIVGFLRERQYKHALQAHYRMKIRRVPQTSASRMASLQAVGINDLQKLKAAKDKDPRSRLEALEKEMREILMADYESEVATREPGHFRQIDSKYHSAPEGYFGFVILLYGARRAFDICKELFQAAAIARQDEANYEAPISLLTAVMETHLRAKEYSEVAKCWELARHQADKLVKTLQQIISPPNPQITNDSLLDPSIVESAQSASIARRRRQVLFQATRIYIRSLLERTDPAAIPEAQRTIKDLLVQGFIIDNLTWNEFIQGLCRRGRLIDAFSACEAYLMPSFPGWRELNPAYVRRDRPGHMWMELRHTDITKRSMLPRYKTLVVLATAYAQVRRDEQDGIGYNPDMGGWTREVLQTMAPRTVQAIETMPRTGDALQRRFLAGLL